MCSAKHNTKEKLKKINHHYKNYKWFIGYNPLCDLDHNIDRLYIIFFTEKYWGIFLKSNAKINKVVWLVLV